MIRSFWWDFFECVTECCNNDTINSILKKMRSETKGPLNWTRMSRTEMKMASEGQIKKFRRYFISTCRMSRSVLSIEHWMRLCKCSWFTLVTGHYIESFAPNRTKLVTCVFNRPLQTLEFLTKLKTKVVSANRISKFDEKGLEGKVKKR